MKLAVYGIPETTAEIKGDKICWRFEGGEFSVYVTELIESMLA